MAASRSASAVAASVWIEPQPTKPSREPGSLDHAPAGLAQAWIDAEDANRADVHGER